MIKAYYVKSIQGPFYNINEDNYIVSLSNRLFGIVDGMGGSGIGDRDVEVFIEQLKQNYGFINKDRDATLKFYYDEKRSVECNFLLNALYKMHADWFKSNSTKVISQRSAASVLIAVEHDENISIISVGSNSAYYLNSQNEMIPLLVPDDSSNLFPNSLIKWPLSAMGMTEHIQWQIREIKKSSGKAIFFFTDGVLDNLKPKEVGEIFLTNQVSLKDCCNKILLQANAMKFSDNQTAMILKL